MNLKNQLEVNDIDDNERKYFYFQNSSLINKRIISITGEINRYTFDMFLEQYYYYENKSDEIINIYINSPGGDIDYGLGIYDLMLFNKKPEIWTYGFGNVSSIASIIFMAGKKRIISPNCYMMLHQLNASVEGSNNLIQSMSKVYKEIQDRLLYIQSYHTKREVSEIYNIEKNDIWLNAWEAVDFGIADEILYLKAAPIMSKRRKRKIEL